VTRRSYSQLCGIATALDLVGDRWALLILRDLMLGAMRFSELASGLPGIGSNTLTARLKELETAGVIRRRLLALPDAGTVYELTEYGHELEPILMALGRWGARSMGELPPDIATHSRWLAAAMLAFHDERKRVKPAGVWELRLSDGPFTVSADGAELTITAGAPERADTVVTASDVHMHMLLTGQLTLEEALTSGAVLLSGEREELQRLLDLFSFPTESVPS
jgi:DNA-binding HxlR family transcriptional regulator